MAIFDKGTAFSNFPIKMVDATDFNTPETGKSPTVQLSLDGATFVNATNSPSEIGYGWYRINLTSAEMNHDVIVVKCTASGCVQNDYVIYPE